MGRIVSIRRRVAVEVDGKSQSSLVQTSKLEAGTLVRVVEGAEGHYLDGSKKATAFIQLEPGTVKRVVGYGENADLLIDMEPGTVISAYVNPMPRGWFKFSEILSEQAPEPVAAAE